jgi:hypothetical protein
LQKPEGRDTIQFKKEEESKFRVTMSGFEEEYDPLKEAYKMSQDLKSRK